MGSKLNALLNILGLIFVIVVNALANILPINGLNTGQISGFYPNYFVPAGFTFGIWGIIYVLLIGFVITSLAVAFGKHQDRLVNLLQKISLPFQITCLLNAGWILAWHYLQLGIRGKFPRDTYNPHKTCLDPSTLPLTEKVCK